MAVNFELAVKTSGRRPGDLPPSQKVGWRRRWRVPFGPSRSSSMAAARRWISSRIRGMKTRVVGSQLERPAAAAGGDTVGLSSFVGGDDVRLQFDVLTKTRVRELHRYWTRRDRAAVPSGSEVLQLMTDLQPREPQPRGLDPNGRRAVPTAITTRPL